ncbi:AraC family transcriptional regulator [Seonamhaeicola sp. ML3]|uniref:helix-turn-helix domain-containing protein n=1 Tax=Seonamhaeicola sp. ML3 TaxID=2937786 RepID=UPI00200E4EFE|nr:AraC family transcriptional regulator [Seonamhaeicola sp. ML3]
MTRDHIDINDFTILVETCTSTEPMVDSCSFEEPSIGVAFYGSGNVEVSVDYADKQAPYSHTKGLVLSFYADENVKFTHKVTANRPLQCIVVVTALKNLEKLPNGEGEIFANFLNELVNPSDAYVEGPRFFMPPEMSNIVQQVFKNKYHGKTKMMFFRSQMTVLLSHFFGHIASSENEKLKAKEQDKLQLVKKILLENIDNPPSLSELSRQIGLNTYALKKDFKNLFGVPVFKYLQNQRLEVANNLIRNEKATVQEAAWHVGYDSLSSFSNAFVKKFGYRPSQIK